MSKVRRLDQALDVQVGRALTKMVLVIMARKGNASGLCYMSQKLIAYEANCSIKSVERAIKELVGRGLLVETSYRPMSRRTKTYELCISEQDGRQID